MMKRQGRKRYWKNRPLKGVEKKLMKDLTESSVPLGDLGKKYGVTRQAISFFAIRRGIKRPRREHTETCSTCQLLLRMSRGLRGNFTTSQTISKQLKLGIGKLSYHLHFLKEKGLVSQDSGKIRFGKSE